MNEFVKSHNSSIENVENIVKTKYNLDNMNFYNILESCVEEGYIRNIKISGDITTLEYFALSKNAYIKVKGEKFMKEYKFR